MISGREADILRNVYDAGQIGIHVRAIAAQLGSATGLAEKLKALTHKNYLEMKRLGNEQRYHITEEGLRALAEYEGGEAGKSMRVLAEITALSKNSDVAKDLTQLHQILSGRYVVRGNYRFELREDGTVKKFSLRKPDGTWWVKDQRTEEEKKTEEEQEERKK